MPDYRAELQAAISHAMRHGDFLRNEFHRPGGPRLRDGKPSIAYDVGQSIGFGLAAQFPADCVWAIKPPTEIRERMWVVLPFEGSTAYVDPGRAGEGRGGVLSIALLVKGNPVLGVVHAPLWLDDAGTILAWAEGMPLTRDFAEVSPKRARGVPRVAFSGGEGAVHARRFDHGLACESATFALALAAAGDADLAVVSSIDPRGLVAGAALIRGAHGTLNRLDGGPLEYDKSLDVGAPFVCVGGPEIHVRRIVPGRNVPNSPATSDSYVSFPKPALRFRSVATARRARGALVGTIGGLMAAASMQRGGAVFSPLESLARASDDDWRVALTEAADLVVSCEKLLTGEDISAIIPHAILEFRTPERLADMAYLRRAEPLETGVALGVAFALRDGAMPASLAEEVAARCAPEPRLATWFEALGTRDLDAILGQLASEPHLAPLAGALWGAVHGDAAFPCEFLSRLHFEDLSHSSGSRPITLATLAGLAEALVAERMRGLVDLPPEHPRMKADGATPIHRPDPLPRPNSRRCGGGVVLDKSGERVLLRRPTPNPGFDELTWTLAKGGVGQRSDEAGALKEVREETGVTATILERIPGSFHGHTTANHYFLMRVDTEGLEFDRRETAEIRWATWDEAPDLMRMGRSKTGVARDLATLEAARHLHARRLRRLEPPAELTARTPLMRVTLTAPLAPEVRVIVPEDPWDGTCLADVHGWHPLSVHVTDLGPATLFYRHVEGRLDVRRLYVMPISVQLEGATR
jgi:8-oxo-dGTP pyrophosphatase MutT (NUDIX family)/3'-phosphoadenosine 5'-phosphosulfate (PAPS) 3'-phosphatase